MQEVLHANYYTIHENEHQEGVISEIYQRPDKFNFQEPPEM